MSKNNYVDLKTNGRLFPSWVLANFKNYKIPTILKKDGEDPCKIQDRVRLYQEFLTKFMDFRGPYKNMLIYHGMGSGKTVTTINIYNMLFNYTPGWNVFIILKATLKDKPWLVDLDRFLQKDDKEFRLQNIVFISYDSPTADKQFLDAMKSSDISKKNLFIIEEAHNFIGNVYSNVTKKQGKRAQVIYDYIIQDKKENEDTRVLLLTATPAINEPYELALLFNLLRTDTFSKSEAQFNQMFITSTTYPVMNPLHKNLFQRRIMGLVSYYAGATPDMYATKNINYIDLVMSPLQKDVYDYFEDQEEKMARKKKENKGGMESYKSFTRQSSNFVFPPLGQGVSGESRPRPSKFKLSAEDEVALLRGKDINTIDPKAVKRDNIIKYQKTLNMFVTSFEDYLDKKKKKDADTKHTLEVDYKNYVSLNYNFEEFLEKGKKSELFEAMYSCSPKMILMSFIIMRSPGPVLVYSNYVNMEGIQIFKLYLKYFNFGKADSDAEHKYIEYHGGIDKTTRSDNIGLFNDIENKYGKKIKVILISPAGAEGVSLRNVRQVHIMEPYWHEVRITQMIGRAIRDCYHKDLKLEERHVEVYRYKTVRSKTDSKKNKQTTDQYIENLAKNKQNLIDSFLDAVKQVAVDCVLYKNVNMLAEEYKCFQFDQQSLFDAQIAPAYKEDLYDDLKMDNGSNSTQSYTMRIKVKKIVAVKVLTEPDINNDKAKVKYSKPEKFLYDIDSHVVYDYEFHYAIGKVGLDDDDLPMKLDSETYIITHMIPIPIIS